MSFGEDLLWKLVKPGQELMYVIVDLQSGIIFVNGTEYGKQFLLSRYDIVSSFSIFCHKKVELSNYLENLKVQTDRGDDSPISEPVMVKTEPVWDDAVQNTQGESTSNQGDDQSHDQNSPVEENNIEIKRENTDEEIEETCMTYEKINGINSFVSIQADLDIEEEETTNKTEQYPERSQHTALKNTSHRRKKSRSFSKRDQRHMNTGITLSQSARDLTYDTHTTDHLYALKPRRPHRKSTATYSKDLSESTTDFNQDENEELYNKEEGTDTMADNGRVVDPAVYSLTDKTEDTPEVQAVIKTTDAPEIEEPLEVVVECQWKQDVECESSKRVKKAVLPRDRKGKFLSAKRASRLLNILNRTCKQQKQKRESISLSGYGTQFSHDKASDSTTKIASVQEITSREDSMFTDSSNSKEDETSNEEKSRTYELTDETTSKQNFNKNQNNISSIKAESHCTSTTSLSKFEKSVEHKQNIYYVEKNYSSSTVYFEKSWVASLLEDFHDGEDSGKKIQYELIKLYKTGEELVKARSEEKVEKNTNSNFERMCVFCQKTYFDEKNFVNHLSIHFPFTKNNMRQKECPKCHNFYTDLQCHLKYGHEKEKSVCEYCGEMKSVKHLRYHIDTVHLGMKPQQCTLCGSSFTSTKNLKRHLIVKHGKGEKEFSCEKCGKDFLLRSAFTRHAKIHTEEKSIHCQYCDKSFIRQDALLRHQRVHTGERPYRCDVCQMSFNHNVSRKHHMRKCHHMDIK